MWGLTALCAPAVAPLTLCVAVLSGPLGPSVTTSGTAAPIILGFLLLAYTVGSLRWIRK